MARGLPAEIISWFAHDEFGLHGNVSTVAINIRCSPGHFFKDSDTSVCLPCTAGHYNQPDVQDQRTCWECPLGTFCNSTAMTAYNECPEGEYQVLFQLLIANKPMPSICEPAVMLAKYAHGA